MPSPNSDRYEKTKRQLNRNFVVNPEVSPTPEEERSSPDSGSLPELVVEPAPNRHDDPPEYYEGLERRMKQYYRQLFLGKNTKTFSPQKSDNDMDRLPTASELIKASLDVYQTVQNREEIDKSHAEMMREAMETRGNVSWHGKLAKQLQRLHLRHQQVQKSCKIRVLIQ